MSLCSFKINATEFEDNRNDYEKYFILLANEYFGHLKNEYVFTYNNDVYFKSMFVVY